MKFSRTWAQLKQKLLCLNENAWALPRYNADVVTSNICIQQDPITQLHVFTFYLHPFSKLLLWLSSVIYLYPTSKCTVNRHWREKEDQWEGLLLMKTVLTPNHKNAFDLSCANVDCSGITFSYFKYICWIHLIPIWSQNRKTIQADWGQISK